MTTLAFVRSLVEWQFVVAGAASAPTPHGLFSVVDLEKAAIDLAGARKWAAFLDRIEKAHAEMLGEAKERGLSDTVPFSNLQSQLSLLRRAHGHAKDHVAELAAQRRRT